LVLGRHLLGPQLGQGADSLASRPLLRHRVLALYWAIASPRWRAQGYRVTLYFLSLPTVEIALSRVAERVRQGGHDVPEDVVRRRFVSGRENFETLYKPIVDKWLLYDNSSQEPMLLDSGVSP
jgi:hypothetical protein